MVKWIVLGWVFLFSSSISALELDMPSVFADQMVLQRNQKVPVWGTVDAGAAVIVKFAGQEKKSVADADGAWRVDLDAMDASAQSRVLTIVAALKGESIERKIADVLVGEVWFAGGQSNMYRPFRMLVHPAVDSTYEPVAEYLRNERATANDPLFRQYRVGKDFSVFEGQTKGRGNWSKAIPGEVNEFCCTAYFFGRELRRELNVPVALISCNLGGTRIEPWIRPQAFENNKVLKKDYDSNLSAYKKRLAEWDDDSKKKKK